MADDWFVCRTKGAYETPGSRYRISFSGFVVTLLLAIPTHAETLTVTSTADAGGTSPGASCTPSCRRGQGIASRQGHESVPSPVHFSRARGSEISVARSPYSPVEECDHVTRRFNASSAGLEGTGLNLRWAVACAISKFNGPNNVSSFHGIRRENSSRLENKAASCGN